MNSKLNILCAYPYMSKGVIAKLNEHKKDIRFVLDSGAFTAWKSGKPIQLDDYCKFIESLPFEPWRYFTLDVIGNPEGSFKNYEIMLERGFKPIPIFTRGDDVSMIDKYYETSDVLGVGGLVGTKGNKGYVNGFMKAVKGRKVHWLGFTNEQYVKHYKPYMCDSSSWITGVGAFGILNLYCGNGKTVKIKKGSVKSVLEISKHLEPYGVDFSGIKKDSWWSGGSAPSRDIGAKSIVRWMLDLEFKLKTKQFAAAGNVKEIDALITGFEKWKQ